MTGTPQVLSKFLRLLYANGGWIVASEAEVGEMKETDSISPLPQLVKSKRKFLERKMNKQSNYLMIAATLVGTLLIPVQAQAQAVGGDQAIFQDERQVLSDEGGRIQGYEQSLQNQQQQILNRNAQTDRFRDFAQRTVVYLEKIRAQKGTQALTSDQVEQLNGLQEWLSQDAQTRANDQAKVQQLKSAIANLQTQRNATFNNLGSDVNAMREDQEQQAEDTKFNQMMAVNQFNELQSEMGACTWGGPPRDGTLNSVGGYGMLGGYGYSFGGGRRAY